MAPDDATCAVLSTVLTRVKTTGTTRAWVCVTGYVGTHQNAARGWQVDPAFDRSHYYRAFEVSEVVNLAKNANLAAAWDWYIDGQGRACLANDVDLRFDLAVRGYADPRRYPKDSDECARAGASSAEEGGSTPDGGELSAVPIALDALI